MSLDRPWDGSLDDQERRQLTLLVEQVGWAQRVTFYGAGDRARWESLALAYAWSLGDLR